MSQFYLSHNQATIGPLSEDQLARMQKSGEIREYFWLWDSRVSRWVPANPAPEPPAAPISVGGQREGLSAICHDQNEIRQGTWTSLGGDVCVLVLPRPEGGEPAPPPKFRPGAKLWINLLEDGTDRSVTHEARLESMDLRPNGDRELRLKVTRKS